MALAAVPAALATYHHRSSKMLMSHRNTVKQTRKLHGRTENHCQMSARVAFVFSVLVLRARCAVWSGVDVLSGGGDLVIAGLFPYFADRHLESPEAFFMAVDEINNDTSILPNLTLTADWKNSACNGNTAAKLAVDHFFDIYSEKLVAFLGPACSTTSMAVASVTSTLYDIPQISHASTSVALSDAREYPFFNRGVASDSFAAKVMAAMVSAYDWGRISVLYDSNDVNINLKSEFVNNAADRVVASQQFDRHWGVGGGDNNADPSDYFTVEQHTEAFALATEMLENAVVMSSLKIVVLLTTSTYDLETVLKAAAALWETRGVNPAEYVWIMPSQATYLLNELDNTTNAGHLFYASAAVGGRYLEFVEKFIQLNETCPTCYMTPLRYDSDGEVAILTYAPFAYDATWALAYALDNVTRAGGDPSDGETLQNALRTVKFEGVTGEFVLDSSGERE